ncbi:MAG: choice-of-anchor D domain-containing protein [Kiritimatiellae bacterium]|nr:choice-of-anchor D domain-containing protein [Kiritimatiellia bacterium]
MPDPVQAAKALREHARTHGLRMSDRLPNPRRRADADSGQPTHVWPVHVFCDKDIYPAAGSQAGLAEGASVFKGPDGQEFAVCILQMGEEATLGHLVDLLELGVAVYRKTGYRASIVRIPRRRLATVAAREYVRWIGEYRTEYRYRPADGAAPDGPAILHTLDGDHAAHRADLARLGISVEGYDPTAESYRVHLDRAQFEQAAEQLWWVRGVSRPAEKRLLATCSIAGLNFDARDSRDLILSYETPYSGYGVVVGVNDGGVYTNHAELRGHFHAGTVTNGGPQAGVTHGTHVAGIIAGRAKVVPGPNGSELIRGVAPDCTVYFRPMSEYEATTLSEFRDAGVQISNYSWGYTTNTLQYLYTEETELFDRYCDQHDMVLVVAAGNDGQDYTIDNPGTGKNVVTVGAQRYATESPMFGELGQVANYSSRGPTLDDGRLKPDLVAPGGGDDDVYGVVSTASEPWAIRDGPSGSTTNNICEGFEWADETYLRMSGTSMAAPHVAGVCAKIKEWYPTISSEEMKALLINRALPLQEGSDDPRQAYADPATGYGMVNAFLVIHDMAGEYTNLLGLTANVDTINTVDNHAFVVPPGTRQLAVTLAYNDQYGELAQTNALWDDIDLSLIAPGGSVLTPLPAPDVTSQSPIEKLIVTNAVAGVWTARVEFVDSGSWIWVEQKYALIADAMLKTPQLSLSLPAADVTVLRNAAFSLQPTVRNTGGFIAAGVTLGVDWVAGFGGDNDTNFFVGNLIFEDSSASRELELIAPDQTGEYQVTVVAKGVNKNLDPQETDVTVYVDDLYEENDSIGAATNISDRAQLWACFRRDDDWYAVNVPSGYERLVVTCLFAHAEGNIDIALYDGGQTLLSAGQGASQTDDETLDCEVPVAGTYYVRVYGPAGAYSPYDLIWNTVPVPDLDVVPASHVFEDTEVGHSDYEVIYIHNRGAGTITGIPSVALPFRVQNGTNYTVGADQWHGVITEYRPTEAGRQTADLLFTGSQTGACHLQGDAYEAPILEVSALSTNFGDVALDSRHTLIFTVRNAGGGSLSGNASEAHAYFGLNNAFYSDLGPGDTHDVEVWYRPLALGSHNTQVAFTGTGGPTNIGVCGSAYLWPILSVSPADGHTFGNVPVGSSVDRTFTVKNTGGGTLIGQADTSADHYRVSNGSYTLPTNAEHVVTVTYEPTLNGAHNGSVEFSGAGNASRTLSGSAYYPEAISVTPSELEWESVQINTQSSQVFTVHNWGGSALYGTATVSHAFFSLANAVYAVAPGNEHEVSVTYQPTSAGAHSTTVTFSGGGGTNHPVSGTAHDPPAIAVWPENTNYFGWVLLDEEATQVFNVENVGGGTLVGSASVSAPFSPGGDAAYTIPAGQTSQVTLAFTPTSAGTHTRTATFSVTGGSSSNLTVWGDGYSLTGYWDIVENWEDHDTIGWRTDDLDGWQWAAGHSSPTALEREEGGAPHWLYRDFSMTYGSVWWQWGDSDFSQVYIYPRYFDTDQRVWIVLHRTQANLGYDYGTNSVLLASNTGLTLSSGTWYNLVIDITSRTVTAVGANGAINLQGEIPWEHRWALDDVNPEFVLRVNYLGALDDIALVGVSPPVIAVTPYHHEFGTIQAGTTQDRSFTVYNTGVANQPLSGTASAPAPYEFPYGASYSIPAGQDTNIVVRYHPTSAGTHPATVTFSGGGGSNVTVTGSAYPAPAISVNPSPYDFGSVLVSSEVFRVFTVQNSGGGLLSGTAGVSSPFDVYAGAAYTNLGAGHAHDVTVRCRPVSSGTYDRSLTFTGDAGTTVSLSACAHGPPAIGVTPASNAFGAVQINTSTSLTFTVQNTGEGVLSGEASSDYPFSVSNAVYAVGAGSNHVVSVWYSPTNVQTHTAGILFGGALGATRPVSGTAHPPPQILVTPAAHTFGDVATGATTSRVFTVYNTGGGVLSGSASADAPFSVSNAAYAVTGGSNHIVTVWYSPTVPGTNTAEVAFTGGGDATAGVAGVAQPPPQIAVWPDAEDFGQVLLTEHADRVFVVQNAGGFVLAGNASVPAPFSIVTNGTYSLLGGESRQVVVRFSPAAQQSYSNTVTFTGGGGAAAAVAGTGYAIMGSFSVDVTPSNGTWTLTQHPAGYTGPTNAAGDLAQTAAPIGPYTVAYAALVGFAAPSNQTLTVLEGQNTAFTGTYLILDTDNDGLTDLDEMNVYGTSPYNSDSDGDEMKDGWEVANSLDPLTPDGSSDPDSDGLNNRGEHERGTNPHDPDSDNDGWLDGYEVEWTHTDPTRPDTDGDSLNDPHEDIAGTNPNDSNSVFRILNPRAFLTNNMLMLRWSSVTNRAYEVELATNLVLDELMALERYITSTPPVNVYTGAPGSGPHPYVYSVRVAKDADADGVGDEAETQTGVYQSPTNTGTHPQAADTDGDGFNDGTELTTYGTDPNKKDTDGDGRDDWLEVQCGTSPTNAASFPRAVVNDFDGDFKSDLAVHRASDSTWHIRFSRGGSNTVASFGWSGPKRVQADYDGDVKTDLAVYDQSSGNWYIKRTSDGVVTNVAFGWSAANPVPADYDGDGKTDIAVYHPPDGKWYIRQSGTGATRVETFGWDGPKTVPADYDGDGKADPALYNQPAGTWYILQSSNGQVRSEAFGWGSANPVHADYDADGKTDLAVYDPATSTWYARRSSNGSVWVRQYGWSGPTPVTGDYDGDGYTDIGVFDVPTFTWYVLLSFDGWYNGYWDLTFGVANAVPIGGR